MSDVRHERRFRDFRGTSAYPPRLAVKADIPDRQVCANKRHWLCLFRTRAKLVPRRDLASERRHNRVQKQGPFARREARMMASICSSL